MAEQKALGLWARLRADWDSHVLKHGPLIMLGMCVILALGLATIVVGLKISHARLTLGGLSFSFVSIVYLGLALNSEANFRRWHHNDLVSYVERLRDYTVGNIRPLKETVEALRDLDMALPPAEVSEQSAERADKALGAKERHSLLLIIAALCKGSDIDYTRPAKAARTITSLVDLHGFQVGETTIEGHLKKIPSAIEARSR